jgi:predicted MarR family transcription regulator
VVHQGLDTGMSRRVGGNRGSDLPMMVVDEGGVSERTRQVQTMGPRLSMGPHMARTRSIGSHVAWVEAQAGSMRLRAARVEAHAGSTGPRVAQLEG